MMAASQGSPDRDEDDFRFLSENGRIGRELHLDHFLHLDQPVGMRNYIRIANEISDRVPAGRLLDWGCGFGQMTYLLRRRGFDVTAYDVGAAHAAPPELPLAREVQIVRGTHATLLPFSDASFDAVLSCGVLEHVDEFSEKGNELKSLREIRRVLKPGGRFLIYQLPQRYTWTEAIVRTFRLGYFHPRRYTASEIRRLLDDAGYRVDSVRRNNMLPKNLTGVPGPLRDVYNRFARVIIAIDAALARVPVVNQLATVMEVVATRP